MSHITLIIFYFGPLPGLCNVAIALSSLSLIVLAYFLPGFHVSKLELCLISPKPLLMSLW